MEIHLEQFKSRLINLKLAREKGGGAQLAKMEISIWRKYPIGDKNCDDFTD